MSAASSGELITEISDEVVVLTVRGPFGWNHTYDLKDVVAEHVQRGYSRFVIDLNQSTRMDTTSVEHVARSFKTVTEAGGTVVIADSREKYANIWKITTLNQIINFYPSVEEAVAAVRQTINHSD